MNKLIQKLNKAKKSEKGFTLVELLVVILIIGILIAIAVPAFLGQQGSGQDADTKSRLTTAFSTAKTVAIDNGGSFAATAVNDSTKVRNLLASSEPDINFVAVTSGTGTVPASGVVNNTVYVNRTADDIVLLGARSDSGKTCTATVRTGSSPSTKPSCS